MNTTQLSPEQQQAVEHPGALMVTAGAGSGKTTVLALRIAHLVSRGLCDPFELLAVTFSVKAARELRERLNDLLAPEDVRRMTVCTLHALGLRMLREYGDVLGYTLDEHRRRPAVLSQSDARTLLKQVVLAVTDDLRKRDDTEAAALLGRMPIAELAATISTAKATATPQADGNPEPLRRALAACYAGYQAELLKANALDFDDLVIQPLTLLDHPEALDYFQARFRHVVVDEFKDVSKPQYELVRRIAARSGNLTVIGDEMQSIYAFRGALGGEGFARFCQDFPNAAAIYLPHNFRSSANIVSLGDALLGDRKPRQRPVKSAGRPVVLLRLSSEHEEAARIAEHVGQAVRTGFTCYGQCAVLCRTNAQIPILERALLDARVPYAVVGRGTFFDHAEIRHVLAYLALALDCMGDAHALRRIVNVPARGLGPAEQAALKGDAPELLIEHLLDAERVAKLSPVAQAGVRSLLGSLETLEQRNTNPPADLIEFVLTDDGIGYRHYLQRQPDADTRLDRVRELWRMARPFTNTGDFLDEVDVMSGQDPLSSGGRDRVAVMTLHDAKGLEFRLVFLAGLEEGQLPHYYGQDSRRGLEEERRLCYVGVTRATDALCLTFARTRHGRETTPSRFLQGLPPAIITRTMPAWSSSL